MPVGIQLQRTKGWRLPPGARKVARPTIYGNPFHVGPGYPAGQAVEDYEEWLSHGLVPTDITHVSYIWLYNRRELILRRLPELRGHDLACFCRIDAPCHRNPLLILANS